MRSEHRDPQVEPDDIGAYRLDGAQQGCAGAQAVAPPDSMNVDATGSFAWIRPWRPVSEHGEALNPGIAGETLREMGPVVGDSVFFFNDTATTEIYTLSLHDALPI